MHQEGGDRVQIDFTAAAALPSSQLLSIMEWRSWLYAEGLVGRDPERYGGLGYGNISHRLEPFDAPPLERSFVITGTQTGGLEVLEPTHFAVVRACIPAENRLVAEGPIAPSLEAMTHGALYALDGELRWVMHVHAPDVWRHADALGLPSTGVDAPYGSLAMAREVERLFRRTDVRERHLFAMGGHEDGVVAFGRTAREAVSALRTSLVRVRVLARTAASEDRG